MRPRSSAVIVCGVLTVVSWGVFWWLAIPRHEICPMIRPAPAGCNSGRVPVAGFWTAATAFTYLILVFLERRPAHSRWRTLALLVLVLALARGFHAVLFA